LFGGVAAGRLRHPSEQTVARQHLAFTKYPRQLRFFGQPMWLAQLNAVQAKPFIKPVPMI